jgi:hypothetical protein
MVEKVERKQTASEASSFALPTRPMPLGRYQDIHRADPEGLLYGT